MNLPVLIIRAYRLIPVRLRGLWSFGTPTSHLALAAVQASATPWRTLLSWSGFGFGCGWKLGESGKGMQ